MWKRLVIPAGVVIAFWLASSLGTTYYLRRLEQAQSKSVSEDLSTIRSAGDMRYTLRRLQDAVVTAVRRRSRNPAASQEVRRLETEFRGYLADAQRTSLTEGERRLAAQIGDAFAAYEMRAQNWLEANAATQPASAAEIQELMQLSDAVADPAKQLGDLNEQLIREGSVRNRSLANYIGNFRMAMLILGPAIGLLSGIWIARELHRFVSRISITLTDAASDREHELGSVELHQAADLPALQEQAQLVALRLRKMVEQLTKARQDAEAAARLAAVGELAVGVAHEIRNPLTSVKLLIQTAADRGHAGAAAPAPTSDGPIAVMPARQLQVIQQEIARIESTLEELMHFARPPAMNRVTHDLRQTVERSLNLVSGRANHAGVSISSQLPPAPAPVLADPEQLHQAFVNLLINGIDAAGRGGQLTLTMDVDADSCRVRVQDSGPGIPAELIGRIFEPFVTSKPRGMGLGLAVSRRIVTENGGALTAANRPQAGAVFVVQLPLAGAPDKPSPGPPSPMEQRTCPNS